MQAWKDFLVKLQKELGEEAIDKWLLPLKIVRFDACNLYLEAENLLQMEFCKQHLLPKARRSFYNNNSHLIKIHLSIYTPPAEKEQKPPLPSLLLLEDKLDERYTHHPFLFSPANTILEKLLHTLPQESPPPFNPLFFYGEQGSGKTHLLQSFAHCFQKKGAKTLYVRAETFTENVVASIRKGNMQEFRNWHRDVDVLLVDDIEYLQKKWATQEEFFHTFNTLQALNKPIILSAGSPPSSLKDIEPRLISRFEWGLCLPLHPLEKPQLDLLARQQCQHFSLSLPETSYTFLLEHFSSHAESLVCAIKALYSRTLHKKQKLTPLVLQELLQDLLTKENTPPLTIEKIVQEVAGYFSITPCDLVSRSQTQEHSLPRQLAMLLCRKHLHMPFAKIGAFFGRDHSTVLSSIKLIEEKLHEQDPTLVQAQKTLQRLLPLPKERK